MLTLIVDFEDCVKHFGLEKASYALIRCSDVLYTEKMGNGCCHNISDLSN